MSKACTFVKMSARFSYVSLWLAFFFCRRRRRSGSADIRSASVAPQSDGLALILYTWLRHQAKREQ